MGNARTLKALKAAVARRRAWKSKLRALWRCQPAPVYERPRPVTDLERGELGRILAGHRNDLLY